MTAPAPNRTSDAAVQERGAAIVTDVPTASATQARREAVRMLMSRRKLLAAALVCQVTAAIAAATAPYFVGQLVALSAQGGSRAELWRVGLVALTVAAAAAAVTFAGQMLTVRAVEQAIAELRDRVVSAIVRLPLAVVEATGTGALVSRTTRDVALLARFSSGSMPMLVTTVGALGATAVALPIAGGLSSAVFFVFMVWVGVVYYNHFKRSRAAYVRVGRAEAAADAVLNETVDGAAVVDTLGVGVPRQRRYLDASRRLFTAQRFTRRLRYVFFPTPTTAVYLGTVASLLWGLWLYERDLASISQVSAVTLYALASGPLLTILGFVLDDAQLTEVSLARLVGVLQVQPTATHTDKTPDGSMVVCDNASFEYRHDMPVLHEVSLTVPSGQRAVIVGASGSGKSTLARLISGIGRPTSGTVTVGGVPVADLSHDDVFRHVMLLTQEYHVFRGTLRRNLALAAPDASDTDLVQSLVDVGAGAWFHALPAGLDTDVASGDNRLSPGQAQEVALARVVLADPAVVILDEATSMLDRGAAVEVEAAVDKALSGRTVIAIAHRLSVAEHADRVLVMARGRITEDGTHAELLETGGTYAQLWHHWQAGRSDA